MAALQPNIDFEWTFVAGSNALGDVLLAHPELEVTPTSFDNPANEPDENLPGA